MRANRESYITFTHTNLHISEVSMDRWLEIDIYLFFTSLFCFCSRFF